MFKRLPVFIGILVVVSIFFISAQCKISLKLPKPHCCIIRDINTNEVLGCVGSLGGSESDCYNNFYSYGNTEFKSGRCEDLPECSGVKNCAGVVSIDGQSIPYLLMDMEYSCGPKNTSVENVLYQCIHGNITVIENCTAAGLMCNPSLSRCEAPTKKARWFVFEETDYSDVVVYDLEKDKLFWINNKTLDYERRPYVYNNKIVYELDPYDYTLPDKLVVYDLSTSNKKILEVADHRNDIIIGYPKIIGNNIVYGFRDYWELIGKNLVPEIHLYNLETDEDSIIVGRGDGGLSIEDVWDDKFVYTRVFYIPGTTWTQTDIMLYDINTGENKRITATTDKDEKEPRIYGNKIIFRSPTGSARGTGGVWTLYDIFLYDLDTGETQRITNTPNLSEQNLAIYKDKIAYTRVFDNASVRYYEVCLHDLSTGRIKVLRMDDYYSLFVCDMFGDLLVWRDEREESLVIYDISTDKIKKVIKADFCGVLG